MKKYYWIIGVLLLASACYEPREGCLDLNATNFGVDADRACSDCCTYPTLRMSFRHRSAYADTVVNFRLLDSVYYDRTGNPYRVGDLRFLLSDVRLVRPNGDEVALSNRIPVKIFKPDGSTAPDSIINDILLVRPTLTSKIDAGTLRANGNFRALRFRIGLSDKVSATDPESLPANHPLRPSASGMEWSRDDGYAYQRLRLLPGDMLGDTTSVTVNARLPGDRRQIELPVQINIPEGYHVEFDIQIDYRGWLYDVSPATQMPETLLNNWIARTPWAFTITSIRYVSN